MLSDPFNSGACTCVLVFIVLLCGGFIASQTVDFIPPKSRSFTRVLGHIPRPSYPHPPFSLPSLLPRPSPSLFTSFFSFITSWRSFFSIHLVCFFIYVSFFYFSSSISIFPPLFFPLSQSLFATFIHQSRLRDYYPKSDVTHEYFRPEASCIKD